MSEWVERRTGWKTGQVTSLSGGLINWVFRVEVDHACCSVVVKRAPPFVASAPQIPLRAERSDFEAQGLRWAAQRTDSRVRVPVIIDAHASTLILEDLGDLPSLDEWLTSGGDVSVVDTLAQWLAELHVDPSAPEFFNADVQRSRFEIQYEQTEALLESAGIASAADVGACARAYGERRLERGPHFIMGDLWPPSVLLSTDGSLWVLDWEFCSRGHASQDTGHLLAHLFLGAMDGRWTDAPAARFAARMMSLPDADEGEVAVHFGCEVISRLLGPFGFRYGWPRSKLADTIEVASGAILHGALPGVIHPV